jgi:outer membrane protein OmpA-like peptidoglycan-associated protein
MNRKVSVIVGCLGVAVLLSACATKGFVREQVGSTETKMGQRVDSTDAKLRETSDRTASNTQALESTGQRLTSIDAKVSEVGAQATDAKALASDAKKDAASVAQAQKESESIFNQRFANRNKYAQVETKSVFFDFNKAELKDEGINELREVAKALKADPNTVLELQGFADARGTDRYNYQLTRERVDSVVRYLVMREGVDLRRIAAVGMGKVALTSGEKADKDTYAKSRRVEMRLLAPQS